MHRINIRTIFKEAFMHLSRKIAVVVAVLGILLGSRFRSRRFQH